jgi:16S rRNA (cytosine1402-N4)-methyltransferase
MELLHKPVMVKEVLNFLDPRPGSTIVDCTIGVGGHSAEILKRISPGGRLIGIDRDSESLEISRDRLKGMGGSYDLVWDDFRNLDKIISDAGIEEIDAIFYDLGVSSYQLQNPERGFSIKLNGPLDMRMDRKSYISAYDLVNSLSKKEISDILRTFGQEHWHNRIASVLVRRRNNSPINTTKQLTDIVLQAMPYKYRHSRIHPATRTFQAFRIAVNRELEALEIALDKSIDYLRPGGRICIISFHSLEDRIVKNKLRQFAREGVVKILTKKPLVPQDDELNSNPRSRSAKLRAAEKL